MSFEAALISHSQPQIFVNRARDFIRDEITKGCRQEISPLPVAIEPRFTPLWSRRDGDNSDRHDQWEVQQPGFEKDLIRLRIWISSEQIFDWNRCELFLKQLQANINRVAFEIYGNKDRIVLGFLLSKTDLPVLLSAFNGEFDCCELEQLGKDPITDIPAGLWGDICFKDYFPTPPYSHQLTCPKELQITPFNTLVTAVSDIDPPAIGYYQAVFQAVSPDHNWHRNVEILLDFEFAMKLQSGTGNPQRYPVQSPSGDLRQMAGEVESKAHNDKPFFSLTLRTAIIGGGPKKYDLLESISTFTSLFQHGGRPLNYLTEHEYRDIITIKNIREMFLYGKTYRPGFLVNSLELTGPVHIPPADMNENRIVALEKLDSLPIRSTELTSGTRLGICHYAGQAIPVCIPEDLRKKHTHLIGRPGMGKSTTQEHIILSDIENGDGVAVLDPHGDLIERLLCLIPEHQVHRCIYLNPGDPEWVPIWNPLERIPGQDIGRTADDIVQAIQSFVAGTGWGDRLEHLLRNMVYSLCHLQKGTFLDISNLLRNKSNESKLLRNEILESVENETVRQFWLHDYEKYGKDELGPPRNKLSKLLVSDTVSLMLSQPDSRFNFREIMDNGMILLVDLAGIGSKVRGILGCFILSLLHLAALSRSYIPIDDRKQFHIHCDEAHRFMTDSLEDLIAETRKYGVSLSLAHQYMSQFGKSKTDAFSSVGSTIIFNLDSRDAGYLLKDLQKKVKVEDLVSLQVGEAIARIGTEIVKFNTSRPLAIPHRNFRDRIIRESRKKYCSHASAIRQWIRRRNDRWDKPFTPLAAPLRKPNKQPEDFSYDEFE